MTVEVNDIPITITHDVFTSYKHQGWFWLDRDEKSKEKDPITGKKIKTGNRIKNHQVFSSVNEDGTRSEELHEVDNKLIPGGMVRHDRFAQSAIRETDSGLICLHFALIGCRRRRRASSDAAIAARHTAPVSSPTTTKTSSLPEPVPC